MREHQRRVYQRWLDSWGERGRWRRRAACNPLTGIAPEAEIPYDKLLSERLEDQRAAALFCHTWCPVRAECLEFAKESGEEYYVYGGTTDTERRHLMKKDRQLRKESA